jgi:hypothetical protein
MLFLLVPYCEAESALKMIDARFAPTLPGGQQEAAVGHGRGLLDRNSQLRGKLLAVIETEIRHQRGDVRTRKRLLIEVIFGQQA